MPTIVCSAERSAILRAVDELPLPAIGASRHNPCSPSSGTSTCERYGALMGRVADLPLMAIEPGAAEPAALRSVACKKAAPTSGVVNVTTQIPTKRRTVILFSATLNDAARALDDYAFVLAYGAVLGTLAER